MDLDVNNLELLHFYTTTTSFTLSDVPELQQIWQQVVPQIAFTHRFLLHGILAFTALHLARVQPERKTSLHTEASAHHEIGLRMFQNAMSNITPQNCDACFAFASIIAAYAWASSDQTGDLFILDSSVSEEKSSVEWASLLRGVHTLLKAAGEWMTSSPMRLILQPHHIDPEVASAADPEVCAKLTDLSQLWDASPEKFDFNEIEVLTEALTLLLEACGLVASSSIERPIDMILVVYAWPIKVPEEFFVMVQEQKPEALIVLAHYSLLLNKVDKLWYMQGMSRRLLQTIHSKIGKEWESWIAWPLQTLVLTEFQDQGKGSRAH
jgi:Fungal specific transcription factor domain